MTIESVNPLLQNLRGLSGESLLKEAKLVDTHAKEFSTLFQQAINQVNASQQEARAATKSYQLGEGSMTLPEVMVLQQKASVAFQALVHTRNHVVKAYQEIMSMQI